MIKRKKNKILIYLAIAVVAMIIITVIGKKTGIISSGSEVKVYTAKAEKKDIIESVTANGKIQPEMEVKISSDVSGEIRELYVKEGDSVRTGQLLARIDPEVYESVINRAEASLNNSRAGLASSRARLLQSEARFTEVEKSYSRSQKMYEGKLISDSEFETAKSTFLTSKAEVEASRQGVIAAEFTVRSFEAGLKEARINLSHTEVFSPSYGTVSRLSVEKGERVVGTAQMSGTEMMRIANLNDMEVVVDVNENDIVKVAIGDTAIIEVDAYSNRKFKGVVSEIANSATQTQQSTSDQVTNFVVKIRILRSSYADLLVNSGKKKSVFRPGLSASVEIQTNIVRGAVSLPIESVTIRDKSDLDTNIVDAKDKKNTISKEKKGNDDVEVVFVKKENKAEIRKVKTGIQDDKVIYIIEGISEGEEIIAGPYSVISKTLKNGDKIKVVSREELFETKEK